MTRQELLDVINETSAELEKAKYDLDNTPRPRISQEDIEDVSDAYQERLEYNYWVVEQQSLIAALELELIKYKEELEWLNLQDQAEEWIEGWG